MKNLTLIILALITFSVNAQQKYSTYKSSNYIAREHDIDVSNKNDVTKIWIDVTPFDKGIDKVTVFMKDSEMETFKKALINAKEKYVEWVATAESNNVKDLKYKQMKLDDKFKNINGCFLRYKDWEFDWSVKPIPSFSVITISEKTDYVFMLTFGKMTSSSNQYIDCDNSAIILSCAEDFDQLISALDIEKINNTLNNTDKKEDLFK